MRSDDEDYDHDIVRDAQRGLYPSLEKVGAQITGRRERAAQEQSTNRRQAPGATLLSMAIALHSRHWNARWIRRIDKRGNHA
jgi:hypothetical protein